MAKKIMQFRYYDETNENNQPKGVKKSAFKKNGGVFNAYFPFTQLGIQTLPGTRIYLNNNEESPIIIGSTGIYELELEGISEITDMYFDSTSLNLIEENPNAHLIIDVLSDA